MSEIWARELRATLLGNQPAWKPTHETTYQHIRRRCDGRWRARRARAGFEIDHSEPLASRVTISRTAGSDGAQKTSGTTSTNTPLGRRAERRPKQRAGRYTRYGSRHPLWGATPVMGRCTRSGGVHCLQIGCSAPNHKNKRGICETTADTHKTRPPELAQFDEVLRRRECDTHKAPGARAPEASAQQQLSQRSTSRRRGRRRR